MNKVIKVGVCAVLVLAACVSMIGFGAYLYVSVSEDPNSGIVESASDGFDLQLPGEAEVRTITADEIEGKLEPLNEWAVYYGEYTLTKSVEYTRTFLDDITIPLTTNSVSVDCTVIIKVGYNADDISVEVDNDSGKIYISIPEITITDNYIILDTVECTEDNNILNPIEYDEYGTLFKEIEDEAAATAEDDGILEEAAENAEELINMALSEYSDYEIVFM